MTAYLQYIRPAQLDSLINVWNLARKQEALTEGEKTTYANSKDTLKRVAAAAAGVAAFVMFGSHLGAYRNIAACILATALIKTTTHVPFVAALYLAGSGSIAAAKTHNWIGLAKDAGLVLAALAASSQATRAKIAEYVSL